MVDKWLAVQASSRLPGTLAEVKRLIGASGLRHPQPEQGVRADPQLLPRNQVRFHAADGAGYAFLAEQVIALDALNPQVAARMARALRPLAESSTPGGRQHARAALERIRGTAGLSKDTLEVVTKALV